MWQRVVLIAALWESSAGQEDLLKKEFLPWRKNAAPKLNDTGCPMASFDLQANRYTVEPVSQRIRSHLELRQKVAGGALCSGPIVGDSSKPFSFEAAHFIPERDLWQGVLTEVPERLINKHTGRSGRPQLENNLRESAQERENSARESVQGLPDPPSEDLFEVCVVSSKVCVATLGRPPLRSVFDRLGMYTLAERTPQINSYVSWMFAVFVIFLVVVLVEIMLVHFLLACLFRSRDGDVAPDEDDAPNSFADIVVPTSYEVIMQVVVSLGRMAVAASTLIVVCCCFVFKREVDPWDGKIMSCYPLVIMFLHMLVVVSSSFKTLLYNSLLRDKLHIVFEGRGEGRAGPMGFFRTPFFLLVFVCTAVFLYTGLMTLIGDARTGSCMQEMDGKHGECGTLQICIYVGLGFWGLLFPVAYCMFLIYNDYNFENTFMPLYKVFSLDGEKEEAPPFLGGLTSVAFSDFVWAGNKLSEEEGVTHVTANGVIAKLNEMKDEEEQPGTGSWAKFSNGTFRWVAESASLWSWRLRMRHSANKALELRLLLLVITAAFTWTVLAALGASVYRHLCIPSLEEITPSIGQLSPEFDPYTFNYNIFVDTHIKSAGLEVIAEKKFTATTSFYMTGLSEDPREEPWIQKSKNVHVPFLVRNALLNRNATQAEELRASRRAPVPIELHVRNAGTTLVYRITVVKLETRVASLTYKYNTSDNVDEVVVHKNIEWDKVAPAEEVAAENEAFADAETEGASVYVPEDAKEVEIDMQRELAIFGPTGGIVVSGFELAEFEAVRKLVLCPPDSKGVGKGLPNCQKKKEGNSSGTRVTLENSVTALPVELQPNGTDPLRFFVSIIRISNRLINLETEGAMGARASNGGKWAGMGFLPAFRPLVDRYETFFEVPDKKNENQAEEWHTLFLRVLPQGNARTNWLEAELRPNGPGDEDLEMFCRPTDEDDEPLDPTVEAATKDLACGASAEEAEDPEEGKSTKELIIRAGKKSFRNHFYVRYKYRLSEPKPFTLLLRVMFHDHVADGINMTTTKRSTSHRTYEVRFLPQAPMRLDFFAPLPRTGPEPLETPPAGIALLAMNARAKKGLALRRKEPKEVKNFGLPVFLDPPFSSDVLVYKAVVPAGSTGPLLISMTGSHSLWVGSVDQPLEGLGRGSALQQEIAIQHRPNCDSGDESLLASAPAPAPAAAAFVSDTLCPVSLRLFERRDGFPRSYVVRIHEALPDTLVFVGSLSSHADGSTHAVPLLGFHPDVRKANSSFQELDWQWESPAPAAAQPAAPAAASDSTKGDSTASSAQPAKEKAPEGSGNPRESEPPGRDEASKEAVATPGADPNVVTRVDSDSAASTDKTASISQQARDAEAAEEAAEKAAEDSSSAVQPGASPGVAPVVPRQTPAPPTAAPRKMDAPLLPFFLQTISDSASEPDSLTTSDMLPILFKMPEPADAEPAESDAEKMRSQRRRRMRMPEAADAKPADDDAEPLLFAMPSVLPAAVEAPGTSNKAEEPLATPSVLPAAAEAPVTLNDAEEPLVSSLIISAASAAAAPAPAAAEATVPAAPAPPQPTAWETGETMPTTTLAILAGSPMTSVTVAWNGLELPSSEREGSWTKVQLSGKALVEGCWCDRKQLGNKCKDRLRKQAPRALELYYQSNGCLLTISTNGVVMQEMEVGLAGSATPAQMERAMEEAADAAEVAEGAAPASAPAPAPNGSSLLSMAPVVSHVPVILPG